LKNGRPITNFESLKELFEFLKFANDPKKHWTNSSGWGMAKSMHNMVLIKTNESGFATKHIVSNNCDETTILDNQS
jgi:hypothetical protein